MKRQNSGKTSSFRNMDGGGVVEWWSGGVEWRGVEWRGVASCCLTTCRSDDFCSASAVAYGSG